MDPGSEAKDEALEIAEAQAASYAASLSSHAIIDYFLLWKASYAASLVAQAQATAAEADVARAVAQAEAWACDVEEVCRV